MSLTHCEYPALDGQLHRLREMVIDLAARVKDLEAQVAAQKRGLYDLELHADSLDERLARHQERHDR